MDMEQRIDIEDLGLADSWTIEDHVHVSWKDINRKHFEPVTNYVEINESKTPLLCTISHKGDDFHSVFYFFYGAIYGKESHYIENSRHLQDLNSVLSYWVEGGESKKKILKTFL